MRILLIDPPKACATIGEEDVFLFEPLALEYLAAGVSKEHKVRILDLRLEKEYDVHVSVTTIYKVLAEKYQLRSRW